MNSGDQGPLREEAGSPLSRWRLPFPPGPSSNQFISQLLSRTTPGAEEHHAAHDETVVSSWPWVDGAQSKNSYSLHRHSQTSVLTEDIILKISRDFLFKSQEAWICLILQGTEQAYFLSVHREQLTSIPLWAWSSHMPGVG